jgi:TolB-like protein
VGSVTAGAGRRDGAAEPPDADACHAQLGRIVDSADFVATDRARRFLAYVVGESLAGRADRIKAYSVATEVFGRDASFDPQSDPIVRVEAGHLRRALERYYLSAGREDPVEITIPKGAYVPFFVRRTIPAPAEPTPAAAVAEPQRPAGRRVPLWSGAVAAALLVVAAAIGAGWGSRARPPTEPDIPRLLVQPFEDLAHTDASAAIARGLTQEIIGQVTKFKDIVVVAGRGGSETNPVAGPPPRYVLDGSVELDASAFRLQAHLIRRSDDAVLWAHSYTGDLAASRLVAIEEYIASEVATTLAQPYGVIFQADASRHVENPPDDWRAYSCTLAYYAYRATLDSATHPKVRSCLEEAVVRFPDYATAWALLSQTYIDEIRFGFAPEPAARPASVDRALAAARRAVERDPTNTRGLQAKMFALYFSGDAEAALRVGEQALAMNPNDSELLGEYGFRRALAGDWPAGCSLIRKARELNPGPLGYYEAALALCAYFDGDLAEAAMWIRNTGVPDNPIYHLIGAVVFGEAGEVASAAAELDWLRTHAPGVVANPRAVIAGRVLNPPDGERLIGSLRKAGLAITEP